ncbi:SMI1/KNR4 family protein [Streptomyces sp. BHT-5-2]|uniref:SMI1/KNR4 family protein n=1 Tax=Streptomyces sp. BHT-5-2 TaxID=2866715 RepID=UPI001C8D42A1|nr:SMI1/KNR4 family protein [Streptomyces sp. BHT-5-2]QZL04257.1 SMI1/KNR4 family protein [Streptomyces sp. BHT-5-2]
MAISGERLSNWIEEVTERSSELMRTFEDCFGREPGENFLVRASSERETGVIQGLSTLGAPDALCDFYAQIEMVSLPDVGNGLFVHPAEDLLDDAEAGQPTRVVGAINDGIIVFASDGGGGLFAISRSNGKVYRLEGGSLVGTVHDVDDSGCTEMAHNFSGFLEYVRQEFLQAVPR